MSTADSPERGAATLAGPPPRILVIQAPYYRAVVDGMRDGARQVFSALNAGSATRTSGMQTAVRRKPCRYRLKNGLGVSMAPFRSAP